MEIMKCIMCRASLPNAADEEQKIIKCEYCDYPNIRPKYHKDNRYNIATQLREAAEFDQAIAEYEKLLAEDETDYTAHWGLLLCKYGIEYVEDPTTGKILPTCHLDRIQEESIQKEAHYIAALEYGDETVRKLFMQEAKQIDEVRADIMAATKNQEPYDVFICYKSKDEWKRRTEDSVWAQDIYEELTKRDYRVFFADKTIELGMKYEPVIFHALYSASIMIVVGTKEEYLNSIWVKNEWSRYHKLTKNSNKTIFLAFKDMDPNCFPGILKPWQAQDLSQVGAMQDLVSAVEKKLKSVGITAEKTVQVVEGTVLNKCPRLLKNGETFLSLDNYEEAESVYKTITKDYPEEYRGWWGLIVCKTKNFTILPKEQPSDEVIIDKQIDVWYRYVKKLAPTQEFAELEKIYLKYAELEAEREITQYVATINKVIELSREQINNQEDLIKAIEVQKEACENNKNQNMMKLESEEASCKENLENAKRELKMKSQGMLWIMISIASALFGLIILAVLFETKYFNYAVPLFLVSLGCGAAGLIVGAGLRAGSTSSEVKKNIGLLEGTLETKEIKKLQVVTQYSREMAEYNRQIEQSHHEIEGYLAEIQEKSAMLTPEETERCRQKAQKIIWRRIQNV